MSSSEAVAGRVAKPFDLDDVGLYATQRLTRRRKRYNCKRTEASANGSMTTLTRRCLLGDGLFSYFRRRAERDGIRSDPE
jgi:hypothetical protein